MPSKNGDMVVKRERSVSVNSDNGAQRGEGPSDKKRVKLEFIPMTPPLPRSTLLTPSPSPPPAEHIPPRTATSLPSRPSSTRYPSPRPLSPLGTPISSSALLYLHHQGGCEHQSAKWPRGQSEIVIDPYLHEQLREQLVASEKKLAAAERIHQVNCRGWKEDKQALEGELRDLKRKIGERNKEIKRMQRWSAMAEDRHKELKSVKIERDQLKSRNAALYADLTRASGTK